MGNNFTEIVFLRFHATEDIFAQIRELGAADSQWPPVFNLVFRVVSFFNNELEKIQSAGKPDGVDVELMNALHESHQTGILGIILRWFSPAKLFPSAQPESRSFAAWVVLCRMLITARRLLTGFPTYRWVPQADIPSIRWRSSWTETVRTESDYAAR